MKLFSVLRREEGQDNMTSGLRSFIRNSHQAGLDGILMFQNQSNDLEPWVFGQSLCDSSDALSPLIAVNPAYFHPYIVAQKVLSLSLLYNRKLYLNFITGTSKQGMESLGPSLSHHERYERLDEFIHIFTQLLHSRQPISFTGKHYQVRNLRLANLPDPALIPGMYIAGQSEAAIQLCQKFGITNLSMARPLNNLNSLTQNHPSTGFHFGVISASTRQEAITRLEEKFKAEEFAKDLLELSMTNTDSVWKEKLFNTNPIEGDEIYSLVPFKHFKSDCPYLVGSHEEVAGYILKYIDQGISTFIMELDEYELSDFSQLVKLLSERAY